MNKYILCSLKKWNSFQKVLNYYLFLFCPQSRFISTQIISVLDNNQYLTKWILNDWNRLNMIYCENKYLFQINFGFFLNIVRVLFTKLRAFNTRDGRNYRYIYNCSLVKIIIANYLLLLSPEYCLWSFVCYFCFLDIC